MPFGPQRRPRPEGLPPRRRHGGRVAAVGLQSIEVEAGEVDVPFFDPRRVLEEAAVHRGPHRLGRPQGGAEEEAGRIPFGLQQREQRDHARDELVHRPTHATSSYRPDRLCHPPLHRDAAIGRRTPGTSDPRPLADPTKHRSHAEIASDTAAGGEASATVISLPGSRPRTAGVRSTAHESRRRPPATLVRAARRFDRQPRSTVPSPARDQRSPAPRHSVVTAFERRGHTADAVVPAGPRGQRPLGDGTTPVRPAGPRGIAGLLGGIAGLLGGPAGGAGPAVTAECRTLVPEPSPAGRISCSISRLGTAPSSSASRDRNVLYARTASAVLPCAR